ncbi:hypothetical protein ABIB17_003914 [Arthrobacter sp. UYEF6]
MSEETNTNAGQGFNRRSVVRGAAWSVPVIAAAIAAPAAAASATRAIVAFSTNSAPNALTWTRLGGNQQNPVKGTGPASFSVKNDEGAIAGPINGIITIRPTNTGTVKPRGIGVKTVTGSSALANAVTVTAAPNTANTLTTTFTLTNGVASSEFLLIDFTFGYESVPPASTAPAPSATVLTYSATLQLTDSRGVQIGQLATQALSTNFNP